MKYILLFILSSLSLSAYSESTLVRPFELKFSAPAGSFNVKADLILSCRYERLVIGDSSEYFEKNEKFSIPVEIENFQDKFHLKISHKKTSSLEINGRFRSNPGCMSELRLTFIDNLYAVGWAGQMGRPISFILQQGYFYRAGDTVLDISQLQNQINDRLVEFFYVSAGKQVNIWLTADGQKLPLSPTSSALDPATGMPYRL